MTDDQNIREGIDACRPGSDDLLLNELSEVARRVASDDGVREVFDRSQQLDVAIGGAFHDVSVPDGLKGRLLAALPVVEPASQPQMDRRRVGFYVLATSAALVMISLSTAWLFGRTVLVEDVAKQMAEARPDLLESKVEDGVHTAFPFSQKIKTWELSWSALPSALGQRGVAYRLTPNQDDAMLLVIDPRGNPQGVDLPPTTPADTAGWCMGAWRENGRVYVLMVKGSSNRYRKFIRSESVAAAGVSPAYLTRKV